MSATNIRTAAQRIAPDPNAVLHGRRAGRPRASSARHAVFGWLEEDEFRIDLSDLQLPRSHDLEVEQLKPSLLSRLFDLFAPLR
ncbi:MAG: hypothetical protein C0P74_001465 [Gammaproteobacteria bacterium]|nr:hypothetical protein [Gammaproteobacteria bacterium]